MYRRAARVPGTVEGLSQASQRIADIIAVIDGIAFQTNITAVAHHDDMTQRNAALAEQSAAAALSLCEQAQGLSNAVSVFQTDARAAPAPSPHDEPIAA